MMWDEEVTSSEQTRWQAGGQAHMCCIYFLSPHLMNSLVSLEQGRESPPSKEFPIHLNKKPPSHAPGILKTPFPFLTLLLNNETLVVFL